MHTDAQLVTALIGSELLQSEAWEYVFPDLPIQKDEQRKMLLIITLACAVGAPYPAEQFENEAKKQLKRALNTIRGHRKELTDLGLITTVCSPRGDGRRRLIVPTHKGMEGIRLLAEQYARSARLIVEKMEALGRLPPLKRPEPDGSLRMLDGQALSLDPDVFHIGATTNGAEEVGQ